MSNDQRAVAFYSALRALASLNLSETSRLIILQEDIPPGHFTQREPHSFSDVVWVLLPQAKPGSVLEARLMERLSLPRASFAEYQVQETNWPNFWWSILRASHEGGRIWTLARQRLLETNGSVYQFANVYWEVVEQDANPWLAEVLYLKVISHAKSWSEWRIVCLMAAHRDDQPQRLIALDKLKNVPAERHELEGCSCSGNDVAVQLIAIDRLLKIDGERWGLWLKRFQIVQNPKEKDPSWRMCLPLLIDPARVVIALYDVWEDEVRREECLGILQRLDATCQAWRQAVLGVPHGNMDRQKLIREILFQRMVGSAVTARDWTDVCIWARIREHAELAQEALKKSHGLATTFAELNAVYRLCLRETRCSCEPDPQHTETLTSVLNRMREIGSFDEWKSGNTLQEHFLPELARLAVTVEQMAYVLTTYFDARFMIDRYPGLYQELWRRLIEAGPALVTSLIPRASPNTHPTHT